MLEDYVGCKLSVFIGEDDKFEGLNLYELLLELALESGLSGGTVIRGRQGFGAQGEIQSMKIMRLSDNLPLVLEFIGRIEKIDAYTERIQPYIREGLLTRTEVRITKIRVAEDDKLDIPDQRVSDNPEIPLQTDEPTIEGSEAPRQDIPLDEADDSNDTKDFPGENRDQELEDISDSIEAAQADDDMSVSEEDNTSPFIDMNLSDEEEEPIEATSEIDETVQQEDAFTESPEDEGSEFLDLEDSELEQETMEHDSAVDETEQPDADVESEVVEFETPQPDHSENDSPEPLGEEDDIPEDDFDEDEEGFRMLQLPDLSEVPVDEENETIPPGERSEETFISSDDDSEDDFLERLRKRHEEPDALDDVEPPQNQLFDIDDETFDEHDEELENKFDAMLKKAGKDSRVDTDKAKPLIKKADPVSETGQEHPRDSQPQGQEADDSTSEDEETPNPLKSAKVDENHTVEDYKDYFSRLMKND